MIKVGENNYADCLVLGAEEKDTGKPYALRGFQEVIFSVRNLTKSVEMYTGLGSWKILHSGVLPRATLDLWKLPNHCVGHEVVLHNEGDRTGFLRLVQFDGVEKKHIRSSGQSWDVGGIYDVDVRVLDIESCVEEFQAAGWSGYADTIEYEFGSFQVAEILMRGHEDVVFALIQRIKPTLEGYPNLKKLSHIFNSSQIVKSMDVSKQFYQDVLGFKVYMDHNVQGSEKAYNIFGMPNNLYSGIDRKICILSPQGNNFGSVELIELVGVEGRDFSEFAVPPNLGILMLRFPVSNIEKFYAHLQEQNVTSESNIQEMEVAPYGMCNVLALRSPDGAWLEFLEVIKD